MLIDIVRFGRLGRSLLAGPGDPNATVADVLESGGFGKCFARFYLLPMMAAIWSSVSRTTSSILCRSTFARVSTVECVSSWPKSTTPSARHFFTGGLMPSADLPFFFNGDLRVARHWRINGLHYSRTLEEWLRAMDTNSGQLKCLFREVYGSRDADRWFARWRLFFLACSELFAYRNGNEWSVSQYRMRPVGEGNSKELGNRASAGVGGSQAAVPSMPAMAKSHGLLR